ncbi:MAG TPA: histidine--tRNA ligase [Candidatus Saccharimonadales bacterium]|nr:histidine--tRNA ligase [Candidatus Saccharimonadales bacterium]
MPLPLQPYKGARDFYPPDKRLQKYMFGKWREVAERYGYEEYDAPILESLEIYQAKTGDEIVNEQTYSFEDRGKRQVVIRPEMTPTVSRMVAARRQELSYPLRWYSIPNLWRYERPQRGRLREHWQLNVDIFGIADSGAEYEIIVMVDDIFKTFGADSKMYEIRLNSRQLIDQALINYIGFSSNESRALSHLIDRKAKMDKSKFISAIDDLVSPKARASGKVEKLLALLDIDNLDNLPAMLKLHDSALDLKKMLRQLNQAGIKNTLFDISLMRGFDYYTGIVFEVYDRHPENNRSMLGGGRYDGLVGAFGVTPLPTVGFGWGDVTLANFLELHHLLPQIKTETEIYAVLLDDLEKSQAPIAKLRQLGLDLAVDWSNRKLGDQIKTANKKSIPYLLVIGRNELKNNKFTLKHLESSQEITGSLSELANHVIEERNNLKNKQ